MFPRHTKHYAYEGPIVSTHDHFWKQSLVSFIRRIYVGVVVAAVVVVVVVVVALLLLFHVSLEYSKQRVAITAAVCTAIPYLSTAVLRICDRRGGGVGLIHRVFTAYLVDATAT